MRLRPVYGLLVTLLCAGFVSQPAYAKDKCAKVLKEANDPLEGKVQSFVYYFDIGRYTALDAMYKNGTWTIHLMAFAQGALNKQGAAGEVAKISVGGQILEIPSTKESAPVSNVSSAGAVFTQWVVEYTLTPEQIKQLGSAPVEAIGVTVGGELLRLPVDSKDAVKVQEAFACAAAVSGG